YNVDVATDVDIGLRNVDFEASVVFVTNAATGERDAVVTQFIANTGTEPISLYAFANLAGHPRQERLISHLKPGQTVTRRFTFASADPALAEHAIRAGIREANGP